MTPLTDPRLVEDLKAEIARLTAENQDLHEKLDESYHIIDDLEFELESVV